MAKQTKFEASQTDAGRYRMLVDAITDYSIQMLDPAGFVTSWNAGAERMKDFVSSEVIGSHFSTFYTEEEREAGLPNLALRVAAEQGHFEREGWLVPKSGSRYWMHVVIDPVRDPSGTPVGYAKITRDLTERKMAEAALRRSEERFTILAQRVRDYAIYMLDSEGRIESWNSAAERINGYGPAGAGGGTVLHHQGVGKGTGLGLSMVHGLVAQSGGIVRLRSKKHEGTSVELWLKVAVVEDCPVSTAEPASTASASSAKPLLILAVDDDALVLFGTIAMLQDLGYDVVSASNGDQALKVFADTPGIDLVVTDQAMPAMTGIQLVGRLRHFLPSLPAILATGYADLPSGAGDGLQRLTKPFTQAALAEAIRAATRGAQQDALGSPFLGAKSEEE